MVEFNHRVLAKLQDPLLLLAERLRPAILEGRYNLVAVDGISARCVAWPIWKWINAINESLGRGKIPIIFINDGKEADCLEVQEQFERWEKFHEVRLSEGVRALVVTENMAFGSSLGGVRRILNIRNIGFDVATISRMHNTDYYRGWGYINPDTGIISGDTDRLGSSLLFSLNGRADLTGVFGARIGGVKIIRPIRRKDSSIHQARVDINTLAQMLIARDISQKGVLNVR
ncbi:hypothetical protein HYS93_04720 [Candidatus Daviesbacteria bacterium]|nr:hypothetical protein [Candidatus Daviesbacteria bacterium]